MKDDVFCSNSIKEGIIFETKYIMAVYDIAPVVEGHTLLIPKRHIFSFIELNNKELNDLIKVMKAILPVLIKLYGDETNSYSILSQVGVSSGMSIPHLHLHILPRKRSASNSNNPYYSIETSRIIKKDEYLREVKRLRKELNYKII